MKYGSYLIATLLIVGGTTLGFFAAVFIIRPAPPDVAPIASISAPGPIAHEAPLPSVQVSPSPQTDALVPARAPHVPPETPEEKNIVVAVSGAVRAPGVYRFIPEDRVQDGILSAHGLLPEADTSDINIAARLMDNTTLYIPFLVYRYQEKTTLAARRSPSAAEMNPPRYTRSGWAQGDPDAPLNMPLPAADPAPSGAVPAAASAAAPKTASTSSSRINLNSATLSELETLPGIGPKTAEKIDAYRKLQPFRSVDELDEVSGIGPKKLEAIRELVTVE